MKRTFHLFTRDVLLGIKDVFLLLEVGFAVIFSIVLIFIIPKDIRTTGVVYIYDQTKIVEEFVLSNMPDVEKRKGEYYVDSREEVISGMKEDEASIGILIDENENGTYTVELLTQPYTKSGLVDYIDIDLEDLLAMLKDPRPFAVYSPEVYNSVKITAMQRGLKDLLPFNQQILPPILVFMIGIMGLFIMVSLIGQERSEATIRAFRISPGNMWEFLISKHLVLLAVSFITFSIFYIPVMGCKGYFPSLLIIMLTVVMGSSIGVILAGFFDNPMGAILWVMLIMFVFGFPAFSLFNPGFSPDWLKIIPTYHTLFAIDAAMFPDNNSHVIWQGAIVLGGLDAALFMLSGFIFYRLIRREG